MRLESQSFVQSATSMPSAPPASDSSRLSASSGRKQARARGAERGANGELVRARDGAGELEIGEIGAGDEQDEAGEPEQQPG